MGQKIGEGNFGDVFEGTYENRPPHKVRVALKSVKDTATYNDRLNLVKEVMYMKDFSHENVLGMYGTFIQNNFPYVILPLMDHGDLKNFIQNPENNLSVLDMTDFACQVASGMAYLEDKKVVHRDLAARNCMINSDRVVKVADFGLARLIAEKDYYKAQAGLALPLKWMAIEALEHRRFSHASDVWSFGITFWEFLSCGQRPYNDVDPTNLLRYLKLGRRLPQPRNCLDEQYQIMLLCWRPNPRDRPSFNTIVSKLMALLLPMAPELRQDGPVYINIQRLSVQYVNDASDNYLNTMRSPALLEGFVDID
ncbi:hypothetical protein CAPTEDRAFT_168773 [Capitella teleta]|uniref:Protein kinase domain-containing protein n=1 Tax=Capitella teleta TaxID=283909 RepID=R7VAK1_CAPTE|nr:hypothetical protein CAPTEDRAFT_168773 [Capitella teleta]|eukprot:ELU15567.1 hypothetical protein CAPTEDRAFT_168773 [Capitella teleta]